MIFMKNFIQINFVLLVAVVVANNVQAQQKASDKSYNSMLMEVKQRQAIRNKMILQMRQSAPSNSLQTGNAIQTNTATSSGVLPQTSSQGKNLESTNNQSANNPAKPPIKSKIGNRQKL